MRQIQNQCGNASPFSITTSHSYGAILKYPFQIHLNHGLNMAVTEIIYSLNC